MFLTSDSGLGASTILRKLVETAREHVPVLSVHGSQSLAKIPYGVLAPYLTGLDAPAEGFRLGVLRELLAEIERLKANLKDGPEEGVSEYGDLPLVVVDDAHAIDEGTAEVLVVLAMAGTINVVVSHSSRNELPAPLPKLWAAGVAENIVLRPLNQEQGHAFCQDMLDGPVLPASSWHYWSTAAGNPLFLYLLVTEAVAQGQLSKRGEMWVGQLELKVHSHGLEDAVRAVLRGLSPEGQQALNLVALSEPLDATSFRALIPEEVFKELLDWRLVNYQPPESGFLTLANPIYGKVIRELVPVTQSRHLHEQLVGELKNAPGSRESLLRRVLWAVEVGAEVDDRTMLRAAVLASKMFQSATAIELANHVGDGEFKLRAAMVKARAKYNEGDYQAAFTLLEGLQEKKGNIDDMLFGSLLRASTRSALGMPLATLWDDAQELREVGEQLARKDPADAGAIRARSQGGAMMVELLALSRAGQYAEMTALTSQLLIEQAASTDSEKLTLSMALAMESERLTAQGFPLQGVRRAAEAFAIEHGEENDVFFLPESILLRQLTAVLCAGDWASATSIMEQFSLEDGPVVFSFGGGASVVRGLSMLRAGKLLEALDTLNAGLQALRLSDPQQLLGSCTAMAAYAAAQLGRAELAARLLAEHVESTGMFVVVAHELAYLSAANHVLKPDGGGLAQLLAQADAARGSGSAMLELNALALALELGEGAIAERAAEVAARVEGPWAAGIAKYAEAVQSQDGHALAKAGELLSEAEMLNFARLALTQSASLLGGTGARADALKARRRLDKVAASLDSTGGSGDAGESLTKRERQVASLAAGGMSDRDIAAELTLALRTVEGHLYRTYTKLGISGRDDLAAVLEAVQRR
ncbi:helix-turn-helix transcriptional regulator [Arthrobacter sp. H35-D1]|nr:helix-turn-helix transcriptional regulator [Arthrobacter sp. H35-D1]